FVSANYKMSFDRLRSQLGGIDAWILVLDTKGINVWCAAGKGTFGTNEIVNRITQTGLKDVVSHRKLIVPQLGASGVSAHKVKELSGFRVIYGPVRAEDIPAFLEAGMKAAPEMRHVRFPLRDRVALIPNDLVASAENAILIAAGMMLLSGFGPGIYSLDRVFSFGLVSAVLILLAYVIGTVIPQMLLPWIPGRMFSVKGAWIGLILALFVLWYSFGNPGAFRNLASVGAWFFIAPAVTSFITMNFTGSSTYTSLSGVLKEMRAAVPVQIAFAVVGVGLWITGLFT
ncbi:MAG: acetyl-CoA synthase subunit gamma, partial [Candidatus Zixiibacteriota bacterium]